MARVEGLLEREQARAQWDLEAERQECSLQSCRQEMELSLAKSPAICMWRWERKVVRFDCIRQAGAQFPRLWSSSGGGLPSLPFAAPVSASSPLL